MRPVDRLDRNGPEGVFGSKVLRRQSVRSYIDLQDKFHEFHRDQFPFDFNDCRNHDIGDNKGEGKCPSSKWRIPLRTWRIVLIDFAAIHEDVSNGALVR